MSEVRVRLPVSALLGRDQRTEDRGQKSPECAVLCLLSSGLCDWGVAQRESRRLLTDRLQVRILPPQLETEGQANRRWHPSRKRATRKGLWVQLPPFPLEVGARSEG